MTVPCDPLDVRREFASWCGAAAAKPAHVVLIIDGLDELCALVGMRGWVGVLTFASVCVCVCVCFSQFCRYLPVDRWLLPLSV
jgi:hypothetical protein